MKKVTEIIKPMLLIIFGALLLLLFMNYLTANIPAMYLVLGILGVTFAGYYIVAGILNIVLGDKLNKNLRMVFDILNVCLYATLFFYQLIVVVVANADGGMTPTAWIIKILSMVAALGLIGLYIMSKFVKQPIVERLAYLFAGIFALALLLDIVFQDDGMPEAIGNVAMVILALYGMFISIMFSALPKPGQVEEPQQVEEQPEEEPQEQPSEE